MATKKADKKERLAERAMRKRQREAEEEARRAQELAVQASLAKGKRDARRAGDAIRRIFAGGADEEGLRPNLRIIADAVKRADEASLSPMQSILLMAEDRSDLLRADAVLPQLGNIAGNSYVAAVCAMGMHSGAWIRRPEDWKPQTHNARRQLGSLARHLFAKYPVPVFMDSTWLEGWNVDAVRKQCWFIHLGAGKNIRDADVPVTLTRSMAHQFAQAPPDVTVHEALRWAQTRALGGTARLFRAIIGTRLRDDFSNDEFWTGVIQYLAGVHLLAPDRVGPIVDYVRSRKFEGEPPPEPGFTMKGRAIGALLERVEEWHGQLARVQRRKQSEWKPSGFRSWTYDELRRDDERWHWSTHELLTTEQLDDEGRAMRHCVGTYDRVCASGAMSIWSLRRKDAKGHWRILTIAVDNKQKRIIEARGQFNEHAPPEARAVLERWAVLAGLAVGQYL